MKSNNLVVVRTGSRYTVYRGKKKLYREDTGREGYFGIFINFKRFKEPFFTRLVKRVSWRNRTRDQVKGMLRVAKDMTNQQVQPRVAHITHCPITSSFTIVKKEGTLLCSSDSLNS